MKRVSVVVVMSALGLLAVGCFDSPTDYGSHGAAGSTSAGAAGSNGGEAGAEGGAAGASASACATLTTSECAAESRCATRFAMPISGKPGCVWPSEAVGCRDMSDGCTGLETRADSPEGRQYWFQDGCFPDGWTEVPATARPDSCVPEGGAAGAAGAAN